MSHDIEAAYAATEVARTLQANPSLCFGAPPAAGSLSVYASREGRHAWPHADGVIELAVASSTARDFSVALEFKRPNEGLHGVLTAIGQSHAYLRKGYAGAVIVIPESYPGFGSPGTYVRDVLNLTSEAKGIGVFTYAKPDLSLVSPFAGKLTACRPLLVDARPPVAVPVPPARTETQWAHVREGSTDPDAFFKYLQSVKLLGGGGVTPHQPSIPAALRAAALRLRSDLPVEHYLSNCSGLGVADQAWRHFWFKYVLHDMALPGWAITGSGTYVANNAQSLIQRSDGAGPKLFFAGRSDSIKNQLSQKLNDGTLGVDDALELLARNYFSRAHSYREDVDSGCEHLGFVDSDGRLTNDGYKFVDACERYGNPNEGLPRALFMKAVMQEGGLGAFLHYVYRLSEARFRGDPLAFSSGLGASATSRGRFDREAYLAWLEDEMAKNLRVMRKVSARGGAARRPFQAELAILRNLGVVGQGFRIGVGLEINWPEFQEALAYAEIGQA